MKNYIFIRHKLISCDSIIPVAMEIHERTGQSIDFITFKKRTLRQIEANHVLHDSIKKIGSLRYIGNKHCGPLNILHKFLFLIELYYMVFMKKASFIHFIIHFRNVLLHKYIHRCFIMHRPLVFQNICLLWITVKEIMNIQLQNSKFKSTMLSLVMMAGS